MTQTQYNKQLQIETNRIKNDFFTPVQPTRRLRGCTLLRCDARWEEVPTQSRPSALALTSTKHLGFTLL